MGMLGVTVQADNRDRRLVSPYLWSQNCEYDYCIMYVFRCIGIYVFFYMYGSLLCRLYVLCLSFLRREDIDDHGVSSWDAVSWDVCTMFRQPREQPISSPGRLPRSASSKPRELCLGLPASLTSPLQPTPGAGG